MLPAGIFPAITTPFYQDGRIYFRKLEHNIARYGATPVAGLAVLGSTGESVLLSEQESCDVLKAAAESAPPQLTLIAGTAAESVRQTLAATEFAASAGYDFALVRTPHYYRAQMTPLAMTTYYRAIADRSPLPLLLYNVPAMTAYDLPVEVVAELAEHPNIAGIKESSGSIEKVRELVHRAAQAREQSGKGGFQVLVGSAHTLLASLQAGACGAVLAFANVAPVACSEVLRFFRNNQNEFAVDAQSRITRVAGRIAGELGVAGVKYGMDFNGYYGGPPRLPLLPVDAATRREIELLLAELRT